MMNSGIMNVKKVLAWITNPEYDAELLLQIQLRNPVALQSCINMLKESFASNYGKNLIPDKRKFRYDRTTVTDTELHIHRENTDVNIILQPVYDSSTSIVSAINIIIECRVSYRQMTEQVFDLQAILNDYKNIILKVFDGYPQESSFVIKTKIDMLSQKYKANCIKVLILSSVSSDGVFVCRQNKIGLKGTINMRTVQCMKYVVIFVQ